MTKQKFKLPSFVTFFYAEIQFRNQMKNVFLLFISFFLFLQFNLFLFCSFSQQEKKSFNEFFPRHFFQIFLHSLQFFIFQKGEMVLRGVEGKKYVQSQISYSMKINVSGKMLLGRRLLKSTYEN